MDEIDTSELLGMERRSYIKSLLSLGVLSGAATALSKEALADLTDDPVEEVPRLGWHKIQNFEDANNGAEPKFSPEYYTISRDAWREIEGAKLAVRKLGQKYRNGPVEVGLSYKESTLGVEIRKVNKAKNRSNLKSAVSLPDDVPATVDVDLGERYGKVVDIPVSVSEVTHVNELRDCEVPAGDNCYYNTDYYSKPGGCEAGQPDGNGCDWTLGTPAWSYTLKEYVMVTAAHCVNRDWDFEVHHPHSNLVPFGDTWDYINEGEGDAATIRVNEGNTALYLADNSGGFAEPIKGMVSDTRLVDMMQNRDYIWVQGRRTGRSLGQIDYIDNDSPPHNIGYDISTDGGDSGAPIFEIEGTDAYIAGIHGYGYCEYGKKKGGGIIMDYAEHKLNLKWTEW